MIAVSSAFTVLPNTCEHATMNTMDSSTVLHNSFFDIVEKDMSGNDYKMSDLKGDVLLVTNVASKWGLTGKNYAQLSKLVDEYQDSGLKVLTFPCNQFGAQEPGSNEEILKFVEDKFKASKKFIWFEKGDVNGDNTRPAFSFLKKEETDDIDWNFAKFLVDHEGKTYKRYGPKEAPNSMKDDIEKLLGNRNK